MAHARIPAGGVVFTPLSDQVTPAFLDKALFYTGDIEAVKTQTPKNQAPPVNPPSIIGYCIDFAEIANGNKKCLALFAVTEQAPGGDREWTERLDNEGDVIALSCPQYDDDEFVEL